MKQTPASAFTGPVCWCKAPPHRFSKQTVSTFVHFHTDQEGGAPNVSVGPAGGRIGSRRWQTVPSAGTRRLRAQPEAITCSAAVSFNTPTRHRLMDPTARRGSLSDLRREKLRVILRLHDDGCRVSPSEGPDCLWDDPPARTGQTNMAAWRRLRVVSVPPAGDASCSANIWFLKRSV